MMFSLVLYSGAMLYTGLKLRLLSQLAAIVRPVARAKIGKCLAKGTCSSDDAAASLSGGHGVVSGTTSSCVAQNYEAETN